MNLPNLELLLKDFSSFLFEGKLSAISVKNYTSDLRHFFSFCTSQYKDKNILEISQSISKYIEEYSKYQKSIFTPTSSLNRRLASIRRFQTFLQTKNIVEVEQNTSPSSSGSKEFTDSLDKLSKDLTTKKVLDLFKNHLEKEKKTHSTIKNYISDLYHYFSWIASKTPFTVHNLDLILSTTQLDTYTSYLKLIHTSTSVINRRTSSIKKLSHFCALEKFTPSDPFERKIEIVKLSPVSWFRRLLPKPIKPSNAPKNRFTVFYDKYHALPFTPYLHLALLVLATTAMAFLGYNQIIKNARPSSAATSLTPPKRQLSFQGRLYDSTGTPITTAVNVIFKLFNAASGPTQLYTSGTCSITPDQDGIFNTLIGDTVCGSEISQSVFADNRDVYLEVTVGAETLTPRQQIATVGYALNSETLQGYPASAAATINTVPVVDNNGDITIAVTSPSLVSTSGTFNIQGQAISLTTATNSGGDIILQPDALGSGQILALGGTTTEDTFRITNANLTTGSLISGYVGNDTATGSGNLLLLSSGATESAKFWVTADGRTSIHTATASANTSAFIVNQNGTGNIFSASSSGVTKFLLNNLGAITTIDGVAHTIDDVAGNLTLTSNGSAVSIADDLYVTSGISTYSTAVSDGTVEATKFCTGDGETNCVTDFSSLISTAGYWSQNNGALFPNNSTVDVFFGGQSTASAMFAFLNVNSGTPTASISSDTVDIATYMDGNGNISTTNKQTLTLGNTPTGNVVISPGGVTALTASGANVNIAGDLTISGDDLYMGTNTSGMLLIADGTNFNPTAVSGDITINGSGVTAIGNDKITEATLKSVNSATDEMCLTYESTVGDFEWQNCGGTSYWDQQNGSLYPLNSTVDFLIGGQATTSAKFAILNVNSGTPTASIAGTVANQTTFFDGNGNISTTNRQSLVIGNSATYNSTGNILLNPNGTGRVGVNTTSPSTALEINGKTTLAAGSTGGLKFAGLTSAIYSNGNGIGFSPQDGAMYFGAGGSLDGYSISNYVYSTTTAGLMRYAPLGGVSTTTGTPGFIDISGTFNPASGTPTNRGIYLNPTINWGGTPGAGSYEGINISAVETSLPTGTNYLIRTRAGAAGTTDKFTVTNGGQGFFAGNLGVYDSSPLSAFTVGSGDLFQINSSGIITSIDGIAHTIDDVSGNLTLTSNSSVISLNDSVTFASTTTLNSQTYTWPASAGSNTYVLQTNGSGTLSWAAQTGGAAYWDQQNGSLYPLNSTVDLLIGGQATTSAKFAVLNINSGTPTASVSAGTAGAASLTATGTLATTAKQTLTLGDTNTGNIAIGTDSTARINTIGNTTSTTATNINSGTGDITLTSTDQIKLTSNKASGGTTTENFSIKNTTDLGITDEVLQVGDTSDMITLLGNGNLGVGTTTPTSLLETYTTSGLLSENLTNGALTSGTSWTQSGDMTLAANAATYTHSAGSGTLSQAAGTLAVAGNSNRLYSFTYTISGVGGTAPVATITTAFAASAQTLITNANGTYTTIFRSTNSPGAFTISITSGAAGTFTIDTLSLKEISGNLLTKTDGIGDQLNVFDGDNNTNLLITDGGTTTFKPTVFDAVYSCTGASCTSGDSGTFADSTTEAKSNSGTPYTAVGTGTTDTFYVGLDHIFNIINLDVVTASSGLTLVAEYYNGAWTALPQYTDNTSALTTDGTISFIAPSDWTTNSINSTTKYWIRLRSSTNVATAPTLYFSTPTNGNRFYVYGLTGDSAPTFYTSDKGLVGIGDATPDHKLDVAGNIGLDASSYINFGDTDGTSGYGFRDNSGVLEFKNSGGAWTVMGSNDWTTSNGALYPKNSTLDVFFGGQATTSAKFAFLNNNSGTPTASIAGTVANQTIFLDGNGNISTTNRQSLVLGNSATYNSTGNILLNSNGTGNVGIGDATPLAMFTVGSGDKFQVDSNGNIIKLNNVTTSFPSSQGAGGSVLVNNGSGTLSWADPTGTGTIGYWSRSADSLYPTDTTDPIGIGFSTALSDANAMLEVDGDVLPHADFATGYNLGSASLTWNGLFVTQIAGSSGIMSIDVEGQDLENGLWNVTGVLRVGDPTNSYPSGIEFYVSGDATVSGTFGVGGKSTFIDTVTVGAAGDGKIDVGTVDPPYTINGEKYATYMSGMVGVKEEVVGNIATTEYVENIGYRKLIDLDQQPKGSDIWLFAMTTEIKKNIDKLSVLLTGEGQTKSWYELDKTNNILAIYSSSPTNVSYRLTAPRFDSHKWSNIRTEGATGFVLNTEDGGQNINSQFDETSNPNFIAQLDGTYKLVNGQKEILEVTTAKNSLVANLQAGAAIVNDLLVDNLTIRRKLVSPIADIDQLKVNDATISGTLYANNIKGNTIDRLDEQLDLLNEKYSTASAILADLQAKYGSYSFLNATSSSDPLALSPLASSPGQLPSDLPTDILAEAIFAKSLSSFDTDLYIQPTGDKPVHLLANLMTLYPDGKVLVNGDLLVTGNIFASNLDTKTATVSGSLALGKGEIATDSGKLIALFNDYGEVVGSVDASGSAHFGEIVTPELIIAAGNTGNIATNSAQTNSNASIGTASIATNSAEIFIPNNKITDNTLVYITPISDTGNQVIYVKSKQTTSGFTVAVPQPSPVEILFNYWLIQTK